MKKQKKKDDIKLYPELHRKTFLFMKDNLNNLEEWELVKKYINENLENYINAKEVLAKLKPFF